VLILSASMGAGHDGAAHELADRLTADGHDALVRDFLDSGPLRIGMALKSGYEFELRHVPSAYDATYRFWHRVPWLCPVIAWLVCALTRRRVLRWVRERGVDVVVSTYPLATLCLGRLRQRGQLQIPAVNFITDFGVHPLWVHKGIDLNLAVHDGPAQMAHARTGRPALACGPAVARRFDPDAPGRPSRAAVRSWLGLDPSDRAVLVVAGSWGVGDIEDTLRAVASGGRFVPVVVCGRDEGLQRRIRELSERAGWRSVVLGWTDRMPDLMAATDALVENAGGLTSFEAMRSGLPVVSFNPIAGHGRDNTAAMAAAGVSRLAGDPADLAAILDELTVPGPPRAAQVATAAGMFRADGAALALGAPALRAPRLRTPARIVARTATALVAVGGLGWAGLTAGVGAAAAAGAGVAHPRSDAGLVAYVGVRLTPEELLDPTIVRAVTALHVSVVVDEATAQDEPAAVRQLVAAGINVVDGGQGFHYDSSGQIDRPAPWSRAQSDVAAGRALTRLTGQPVTFFAPGRRITAFDLFDCRSAHLSVVVPDAVLQAGDADQSVTVQNLKARGIYLLNGIGAAPDGMNQLLAHVSGALQSAGLQPAPLALLR
jgi:processive 1,2-diacylglycerol beta-glucosyltransferase